MEKRVREEKIEQAKKAIASDKYCFEIIADIVGLPLEVVQEIAEDSQKVVTA